MDPGMMQFLQELMAGNREAMNNMVASNQQVIAQLMSVNKATSMVDTRGIGKPAVFKGEESKFTEWMVKLNAYIRSTNAGAIDMLKGICTRCEKRLMTRPSSWRLMGAKRWRRTSGSSAINSTRYWCHVLKVMPLKS